MVDVYTIIAESRYGYPLTGWIRNYAYSAIGKDDLWLAKWVWYHRSKGHCFISFDYSKYDSTIPSWLIKSAFDVIRSCFRKYDEQLLAVIEEDFINKNIITGDGVIHVTHGNPSGSRLTAIINGICNEIITETWLLKFDMRADYNIMGDDNLIYLHQSEVSTSDVQDICDYITHNFGIHVNASKSNYGTCFDDPEYLSRFWGLQGPWRHQGEVISLIAYPERKRVYSAKLLQPSLVLYAYILAYPTTMRELMNVSSFMSDFNVKFSTIEWTREMREAVPYNLRTHVESLGLHQVSQEMKAERARLLEGDSDRVAS
jgi:hypothetical protein